MTATHYFETGMYRDCSCGWKAPHGSWDNSADLRKLWEKHVSAITQDGGPATDRLQQKAAAIVREQLGYQVPASLESMRVDHPYEYKCALAGLTAGIAMAAERDSVEVEKLFQAANTSRINLWTAMKLQDHPQSCECYGCGLTRAVINFALYRGWENTREIREREAKGEFPAALAKGETQHG